MMLYLFNNLFLVLNCGTRHFSEQSVLSMTCIKRETTFDKSETFQCLIAFAFQLITFGLTRHESLCMCMTSDIFRCEELLIRVSLSLLIYHMIIRP